MEIILKKGQFNLLSLMCGTRMHSLEGVGPVDEVEVQVLQFQVLQGLHE